MRKLAVVMDFAALVFCTWSFIASRLSDDELAAVAGTIAFLLLNLVALLGPPEGQPGWLSLFLTRKRLEESNRIAQLRRSDDESRHRA